MLSDPIPEALHHALDSFSDHISLPRMKLRNANRAAHYLLLLNVSVISNPQVWEGWRTKTHSLSVERLKRAEASRKDLRFVVGGKV